jgi:hypothetical protein
MRWSVVLLILLASSLAFAQESKLQAELRREGERVSDACSFSFKSVPTCAYTLFTDHPLHIAAGSMPPQNGFGLGGAFVWSKNTRNWRMSWDADALGAFSGAWRAGAYMQLVHTPHPAKPQIQVLPAAGAAPSDRGEALDTKNFTHPYTVINFYAQTISLNKLFYFGEGNDTKLLGKTVFGMSETIIGVNAIKPVYEWSSIRALNLSLFGEINGRFVNLRGNHDESSPSIELLYDNTTAPGLSDQPGFLQMTEGVRIKPVIADRLQLNYMANFQQYFAPSNSDDSFLRWTADLNHTFYLYGYTKSAAKSTDGVGPDECAPGAGACPTVSRSRNLNGSIGVRLLISESITSGTSVVPFYFQPTLGGSDINGAPALPSYQDYRFRAPNVLLLQEKFEHSIWGPLGFSFNADQGKVALTRGDIGFDHLKHSFATGLTLRAGGFPMVYLLYAWGGSEGQHTIGSMNTSLLGGSARPSLF